MTKALNACVSAVALAAVFSVNAVNAQDVPDAIEAAPAVPVAETPSAVEATPAADYSVTPGDAAQPEEAPSVSDYSVTPGESAESEETPSVSDYTVTPAESVEPAAEPEPVVEAAAEEEAEAEAAVEVVEAPAEKPVKAKKVKEPKAPKEPRERGECAISYGARVAMGTSAFAGHKAITHRDFGRYAIQLGMAHSTSIGLALSYDVTDLITVAVEAQYTIYNARGSFSWNDGKSDFGVLNEAGVELHSVELPVMARFNNLLGPLYAEVGPQVGANVYGKIYANDQLKKPTLNDVAFGPAAGIGVSNGTIAVGVRGYYNVLEYAENSDGYPWTVQGGVTVYGKF